MAADEFDFLNELMPGVSKESQTEVATEDLSPEQKIEVLEKQLKALKEEVRSSFVISNAVLNVLLIARVIDPHQVNQLIAQLTAQYIKKEKKIS